MMYGFWYNGKHTWKDFKIGIKSKVIGHPNKRKVKYTPPFSNKEIDFSEIYGSQVYEPRILIYELNLIGKSTIEMNVIKTKVVNWLMNSNGKQPLYDDEFPNYYFLVELENGPVFEKVWREGGPLVLEFTAYPFMIHELQEGNDIWDTFNSELDVAQFTNFDVNGSLDVKLINNGTPGVVPRIITDSVFTITTNGATYNVGSGTTEDVDFVLKHGVNKLTLEGNGHIEFKFYQELI